MPERQSTRAINARKKALKAAKTFQKREEHLLSLAEDYFKISESNGTAAIEKKNRKATPTTSTGRESL